MEGLQPPRRALARPDQAIPRSLRGELARPELLARLEAARDLPLVLLIAPSGFGKTTLLAQYVRAQVTGGGRQVAWLSLGEDEADPATLADSLTDALAAAVPHLGLRHSLQARGEGPGRRARALARDLAEAEDSLCVVLDETERLGPEAGDWLERLLGLLPEGHQLLMAGFEVPLRTARLQAGNRALVLGPAELAFGPQETEAYLRLRGQALAGPGAAADWHRRVEGWPAGLALLASGAGGSGTQPGDLVREVLDRLPPELRAGLAEASVLELWSEAAAARLALPLPPGWLGEVRRAGLPLAGLGGGTFRPHRLLVEALEEELRARPGRHAELHARLARQAEAEGDPLEAVRRYRLAGQEAQALRLAATLVPRFETRGDHHLIRRVLEPAPALPPALRRSLASALLGTGEAARGEAILRELRAQGEADAPALAALAQVLARQGQFQAALDLAAEAQALSPGEARATLLHVRTTAHWGLGHFDEMRELGLRAVEEAERTGDLPLLGTALFVLASAHTNLGRPREAVPVLERGITVFDGLDTPLRALAMRNDLANAYVMQNRTGEAERLLARALRDAEECGSTLQPILLGSRGDLALWRGDVEGAARDYRRAVDLAAEFGLRLTARTNWIRLIEAGRRLGDPALAAEARSRAADGIEAASGQTRASLAFQEALDALTAGDEAAARAGFEAARAAETLYAVRAAAYRAELDRRAGHLTRETVADLLARLDGLGSDAALHLDQAALAPLYAECAARGWWPERLAPFAGEALRVRPSSPPRRPRLEVRALGPLEVRLEGQAIRLPFARCGELLVWLMLHGPATRDEIVTALWDGSREARHAEYFRVAVRRLRAALTAGGELDFNPLPFEQGRYRLSEELDAWLDAAQLAAAPRTQESGALAAALDLYGGEFLAGCGSGWVQDTRTRCLDLALETALALGRLHEPDRPRKALAAYLRATELDPLDEDAHGAVVRVYRALGDEAAALRAERQRQRLLGRELGEGRA